MYGFQSVIKKVFSSLTFFEESAGICGIEKDTCQPLIS